MSTFWYIFLIFFGITGIIVNLKGFRLKTTIISLFVFLTAFFLFWIFPLEKELPMYLDEHAAVTEDGTYEITLYADAERVELSDPDAVLLQDGKAVTSDFRAGTYTVETKTGPGGEELTYTAYISSDFFRLPLAVLFAFTAAWVVMIFRFAMRLSMTKRFLLFVIPLALIYLFLFPVGAVPDARFHFQAAYRYSNLILGKPEWTARAEDTAFFEHCWKYRFNTAVSYKVLQSNFHFIAADSRIVDFPSVDKMSFYSPVNYLPQIAGLVIGRLIGLGTVPTIYLSRILILAAYIAVFCRIVKTVPVGKSVFFLVAILPVSLNMSSTYSYDAMVLIAAAAFIAAVLAESPAELLIWSFVLGSVKGGGYLLLLPLVFFVKQKKWLKWASLGSAACSIVLFNLILAPGGLFQFGTVGDGHYTAMYALQHPLAYLRMSANAYLQDMDLLFSSAGGTYLSWILYAVPFVLVAGMLVIGWIMAAHERDEKALPAPAWLWKIPIILVIILTPVMLLSWTEIGKDAIQGLEGRYYLPLIIPALLLLGKRSLYAGENGVVLEKSYRWLAVIMGLSIWFVAQMFLTTAPTY